MYHDEIAQWGDKLDVLDARHVEVAAQLAEVTAHIEASRMGQRTLTPIVYSVAKDRQVGLRNTLEKVERAQRFARGCFYAAQSAAWMDEQDDIIADGSRKYRLQTVWQCWRDVEATRLEVRRLNDRHPTRQRIDAQVAMEKAEGLYGIVSRAFDGREQRETESHIPGVRNPPVGLHMTPPKRPLKKTRGRAQSRRSLAAMLEC